MRDLDLKIGAQVHCKDGRCGKLSALVTDPEQNQITGLVIEKGLLLKEDRVVPLAKVVSASEETVHVDLKEEERTEYPEFDETEMHVRGPDYDEGEKYVRRARVPTTGYYTPPPPMPVMLQLRQEIRVHEGVKAESVVIGRGMKVRTLEGDVGRVDHVLVDAESGKLSRIGVDPGMFGEAFSVPMEFVREIDWEAIVLKVDEKELETTSRYTPWEDDATEREILHHLLDQLPHYAGIEITVSDGVARMAGTAPDEKAKRHLESVVRSVDGVIDVENEVKLINRREVSAGEESEKSCR
jgi:uncharacterized protein YrrD